MDIEAIVKKHSGTMWIHEARIRNALTELAAGYEAVAQVTKMNSDRLLRKANERISQLEAERLADGWNGWRDVAVHGYPEEAQEVLFVHKGKTVHGAFIGEIFWHSNEKCVAALWRPLPTPLNHDEWRSLLPAAPQQKKEN